MAKNYLGDGRRINVPANKLTAAVSAGDLVNVDALYGVAINDGAANDPNVIRVDGEFSLAKATGAGTGGNMGAKANADGSNLITAGVGTYVGVFTADAGDNDTTARVKLIETPA